MWYEKWDRKKSERKKKQEESVAGMRKTNA